MEAKEAILPHPADVDAEALIFAWAESFETRKVMAGYDLPTVVKNLVQYSIDTAAPSIAKLAFLLKKEGPLKGRDWGFEAVETSDPWKMAFKATNEREPGGLLYFCELRRKVNPVFEELSHARRIEAIKAKKASDPTAMNTRLLDLFKDYATPEEKLHPEYWLPPESNPSIKNFKAVAFSEKHTPSFYKDTAYDLNTTIRDYEAGRYCIGQIISGTPSTKCGDLHLGPEPAISYVFAPFEALWVLYQGFEAVGLTRELDEQGKVVSDLNRPANNISNFDQLASIAHGLAYCDSGFAGPISTDGVREMWSYAVQIDMNWQLDSVDYLIEHLFDQGYTTRDNEFSCNDINDHAHVSVFGKGGILWIRGQNGNYAIKFENSDENLGLFKVPKSLYGKAAMALTPDTPGFLGDFYKSEAGKLLLNKYGRLDDRLMLDINGIILKLETIQCCLEEELKVQPGYK